MYQTFMMFIGLFLQQFVNKFALQNQKYNYYQLYLKIARIKIILYKIKRYYKNQQYKYIQISNNDNYIYKMILQKIQNTKHNNKQIQITQILKHKKMIPSQRRDGVFTFNMHSNPLLPIVVDQKWRKDSFRDVNIYVPEIAKNMISSQNQQIPEIFTKFSSDKSKQWNDISIQDMLGKFSDLGEMEKKDK